MADIDLITPTRGIATEQQPATESSEALAAREALAAKRATSDKGTIIPLLARLCERAPAYAFDHTVIAGRLLRVYGEITGLRYQVLDAATGTQVVAETTLVAGGTSPRAVPCSGFALLSYLDGTSLLYAPWDPAAPSTLTFQLMTNSVQAGLHDSHGLPTLDAGVLVAVSGTNTIYLRAVDATGTGGSGLFTVANAPDTDIAVAVETSSTVVEATSRVAWLSAAGTRLATRRYFHSGENPDQPLGLEQTLLLPETATHVAVVHAPAPGAPERAHIAIRTAAGTTRTYTVTDAAILEDTVAGTALTWQATETGGSITYQVLDADAAVIQPPTALTTGTRPRVIAGDQSHLFITVAKPGGDSAIYTFDPQNPAAPFADLTLAVGTFTPTISAPDDQGAGVDGVAHGAVGASQVAIIVENTASLGAQVNHPTTTAKTAIACLLEGADRGHAGTNSGVDASTITGRLAWLEDTGAALHTVRFLSGTPGTERTLALPGIGHQLAIIPAPTEDAPERVLVAVALAHGAIALAEATPTQLTLLDTLEGHALHTCDLVAGVLGLETGDHLQSVTIRLKDAGAAAVAQLARIDWTQTTPDDHGRPVATGVLVGQASTAGAALVEELELPVNAGVTAADRYRLCLIGPGAIADRIIARVDRSGGAGERTLLIPPHGLDAVAAGDWIVDDSGNLLASVAGAQALFALPGLRLGEILSSLTARVRDAGTAGRVRIELLSATAIGDAPTVRATAESAGTGALEHVTLTVSRFLIAGERYHLRVTALGTVADTRVIDLFTITLQ